MDNQNNSSPGSSGSSGGNSPVASNSDNKQNTDKSIYRAPSSGNKFGVFFSSFSGSKVLSFAVLALIIAAVPLTVFIAQKQQEIRQRADEGSTKIAINCGQMTGATCVEGSSCDPDSFYNMPAPAFYSCGNMYQTCCYPYHPGGDDETPIPTSPPSNRSACPVGTKYGSYTYYCSDNCGEGGIDQSRTYNCSTASQKCCIGTKPPTTTPTGTITPALTSTITLTPVPTSTLTTTPPPTSTITLTSTPPDGDGQTVLDVELSFMAIGNDTSRAVNNNPKTKKPDVLLEIFTPIGKEPIATKTAQLTYDPDTGTFKGTYNLEDVVKRTREYSFRVKTNKYLGKLLGKDTDQIVKTIVKGSRNSAPKTSLIVGDVNNDNRVDIADANIFFACWNKTINTPVPLEGISAKCDITDLDDDWVLHPKSKDYGWFMESIGLVEGD